MEYPKETDYETLNNYFNNRSREDELRDLNKGIKNLFKYPETDPIWKLYVEYTQFQESELLNYINLGFTNIVIARRIYQDIHGIMNNRHFIFNGRIIEIR